MKLLTYKTKEKEGLGILSEDGVSKPGDVATCEIQGIGTLTNPVC